MPGQVIVAQPGTLTGSIGIFAGKFVVSGALEKLGVTTETVQSGRNATIYSPFAPFSPEQRAKVQNYMQGFYDNFVEKAAESRHTTPERIDAVAQGRVWTGQQARSAASSTSSAGSTTRSRSPRSARRFRPTKTWSWSSIRRGAASTRR